MVGVFLVSHGGTSAGALEGVQQVRDCLQELAPQLLVEAGCLEGLSRSLAEQIMDFAGRFPLLSEVRVVPLFLVAGGHVLVDMPEQVGRVRGVAVRMMPFLGSLPCMGERLAGVFAELGAGAEQGRLLVAHGSSLTGSMELLAGLARGCGAELAVWVDRVSVSAQVEALLEKGCERVWVLPYFLFAGKITGAIAGLLAPYGDRVCYLPVPFGAAAVAGLVRELI